jgi:serine/threonine protein kinase
MHTPSVVHGDVKPANLVRRKDGKIVLVDFGIARAAVRPKALARYQVFQAVTINIRALKLRDQVLDRENLRTREPETVRRVISNGVRHEDDGGQAGPPHEVPDRHHGNLAYAAREFNFFARNRPQRDH